MDYSLSQIQADEILARAMDAAMEEEKRSCNNRGKKYYDGAICYAFLSGWLEVDLRMALEKLAETEKKLARLDNGK